MSNHVIELSQDALDTVWNYLVALELETDFKIIPKDTKEEFYITGEASNLLECDWRVVDTP